MARRSLPSATRSPRASSASPAVWCLTLQSRNEAMETKRSRDAEQTLDRFVALPPPEDGVGCSSPPVEDHAGNDDHRRHRQHLRKRFRGGPFGGFLHVYLPRLGHDLPLRGERERQAQFLTRNTPRRVFALMSPHSANIDSCESRILMRRQFDSEVAESASHLDLMRLRARAGYRLSQPVAMVATPTVAGYCRNEGHR